LTSLDALRGHLDRLAAETLSPAGGWQVGQIFYHLAASFEASCTPSPSSGSQWARLRKLPLRLYVRCFGLPRGASIPAEVRARVEPLPEVDEAEQLARLRRAIDAFEAKRDAFPAHPLFGPLSRAGWRRFHLRHCELHLGHILTRS
jgi:hypothetical protein